MAISLNRTDSPQVGSVGSRFLRWEEQSIGLSVAFLPEALPSYSGDWHQCLVGGGFLSCAAPQRPRWTAALSVSLSTKFTRPRSSARQFGTKALGPAFWARPRSLRRPACGSCGDLLQQW